jgi:hypothetical protein
MWLTSVFLWACLIFLSCNQNTESSGDTGFEIESKFSVLEGPYLGQTAPGLTAEMFAPGLLTAGGNVSTIAFSPGGREFALTLSTAGFRLLAEPTGVFRKGFMMFSRIEADHWTEPKEFAFSVARKDHYPSFSPDGTRLFFNSNRNATTPWENSSSGIWYVDRVNDGWSEPKEINFGENYQGGKGIFPTVAASGNLYFALWPTSENGYIYMSRFQNGKYLPPERLGDGINDEGGNHPYIAPDESYIIFDDDRAENNFGQVDLYISFRDQSGKWRKAQNLGDGVNTLYGERRPFLSFDGKYLFFASDRVNPELPDAPITLKQLQQLTHVPANGYQHIYWVNAKVIERLKPENLDLE